MAIEGGGVSRVVFSRKTLLESIKEFFNDPLGTERRGQERARKKRQENRRLWAQGQGGEYPGFPSDGAWVREQRLLSERRALGLEGKILSERFDTGGSGG